MNTPHRVIGSKKDGRWLVTARQGPYRASATAEGTPAGFRKASEMARQRLLAKMREN